MELRINKHTILNIVVFVIFGFLTFFVGLHHEPWADEAQAWLIARDCTIPDMILHVLKYEGHPILWFAILRILHFIHYPYKLFFLLPWIASCIGVYLLVFKSKLPGIIKYLFPFTYFIFYQSAAIARNHSLLFPMFTGIAILYKDRLKHPYWYSLLLILTASVSAYSFVIAFVFLAFFVIDIFQAKKYSIRAFIPHIIIFTYMLFTALYLIKPADHALSASLNIIRLNPLRILYLITRGYFNTPHPSLILLAKMITVLALYIYSAKAFCKSKRQVLFFTSINLTLAIAITALVCKPWHAAYFIITLISTCAILADANPQNKYDFSSNKIFYIIISLIFATHIYWSYKCSLFDIHNNYSGAKSAAEFIKSNNLETKNIKGFGYKITAIQPYFDKNLYSNYNNNSAYWVWSKPFYQAQQQQKDLINTPVIILDTKNCKNFINIINDLQKSHNSYFFNGYIYTKGHPDEEENFVILVKK